VSCPYRPVSGSNFAEKSEKLPEQGSGRMMCGSISGNPKVGRREERASIVLL
jgi:hypothetical protein